MSEITLRQLQYYVSVIDHGSVTAAAISCHISQAAASMAVGQLEKAVGADLLIRTRSKKVVPTPAGITFAAHARAILERVAEASDAIAESMVEMRGPLQIGCAHTLSPRLMPGLVDHFVSNHPLVDVGFREGAPSALQEDVRNGRLDVALVYEQQADDDLERARIATVRLHVVLSAHHELAGRTSIHLAEIAHEPAILLDVPPTVERLTAMMQAAGVEPRMRWTSSNMETIRAMVARGLGYSFMNSPPSTGTTYEGGKVVFIPVADRTAENAIVALRPAGQPAPRRVRAAIDFLRETGQAITNQYSNEDHRP
ncbi:LysR family transcriptional regulator [Pseudarthrobacter sp. YS3]|uniref:LysR family transcriptional regulator n=1 Tax=Pseudarthrobacter sp. YS3 TaxID=3453718 RepID=UPI003EEA1360